MALPGAARRVAICTGALIGVAANCAIAFNPDSALPEFSGRDLSGLWALPFVGLILSIALLPLLAPKLWHAHFGKIAALWAVAFLGPFVGAYGAEQALHHAVHAIVLEYIPFIAVLFALYTIAGGICVRGGLSGTPARNTALIALGAALASVMGTTGAAMLLIRPLLVANTRRRRNTHVVVFFILLVGNIGGALSPLGDPPLFIGFLKGVDFFWTTRHLLAPTLFLTICLLAAFYVLDTILLRRESGPPPGPPGPLRIEGKINFALIAGVIGAVLLSGIWHPGVSFAVLGTPVELESAVRDGLLIVLAAASLLLTSREVREHNAFNWAPIVEVGKLFAAIFVTIIPAIAMLQAGADGALAGVISLVVDPQSGQPNQTMMFWLCGVLSALLDNAPTYLVFFNLAGGDAGALMSPMHRTLAALSAGAVYFGALTYVGNAPNFMIKAIAEDRSVAMPSFFGFLAYSAMILLPLLALVSWLFI